MARDALQLGENGPDIPEYLLAELTFRMRGMELHTVSRQRLASWIADVVHVESPVHLDEVARRIADAAGVTRIGNRIREALREALGYATRSREVRRQGDFLWRGDMESPEVRDRSNISRASRRLELVAPEELALAVERVVAGSYGIHRHEAPGAAVRLLGFARLTQEMRTRVESVIGEMIQDGRLLEQGDNLIVGD